MSEIDAHSSPGCPRKLGDFRILGVLGEGGSGTVYDARWGHREVALKVLRGDLGGDDRDRFLAEARLLVEMTHPGVVKVLSAGSLPDGRPFLAMEKLPGESLARRLGRGPLPLPDAIALFVQLCDAVAAMHARALIHRDLKPENVMLVSGPTGEHAVLLDFGIAKQANEGVAPPTQSGMVRGTPAYMAPERFFGHPASIATDVYELAVTLFAMIAGRLPWADSADPEVRLNPARLGAFAEVPPALDELVARALSTRAPNRPPTVMALCEEVMRAAGAAGAVRRSTAPMTSAAPPPAPAPTPPAPVMTARRSPEPQAAWPSADRSTTGSAASGERAVLTVRTRRRWPLAVVAGAILAVGATSVYVSTRGGPATRALLTGPDDPWSGEGPTPVLPPDPEDLDDAVEPLAPERRVALRDALAGSVRRHAPDVETLIGLAVAEVRHAPELAKVFARVRAQPLLRATLTAMIGRCELPFGDRVDWLSLAVVGPFGAYDLIASGDWTRTEIEACVGEGAGTVEAAGDGALSVVSLAGGRTRVIGWLDDRTFIVSTRADADVGFMGARLGKAPRATRVLELAHGIDRRATLWLVATRKGLEAAVESPVLRQADLTARVALAEADDDGAPMVGFQVATYFADEATAQAGQRELDGHLAELTAHPAFDLVMPAWTVRRDGTMVRLHGMVPTGLVAKLQRSIVELLP